MKVAIAWPNMWLSGRRFRKRSGKNGRPHRRYFSTSRSTGTMFARTFRCVMTTPLGSAVAPDVKMISATSSREIVGLKATWPEGRPRPGTCVPVELVQLPDVRAVDRDRRHVLTDEHEPGRHDPRDAREKVGRGAVMSTGTTTTPPSRQPQNATIHSGRFSLQKTTLSPLASPRSRSRAANPRAARPTWSYV